MGLYEWALGNPWVYDHLRPMLMGGFDFSEPVSWLETKPGERVVDVGCGTGFALNYLNPGVEYYGFDTCDRALQKLKENHPQEEVRVFHRIFELSDLERIQPQKVVLLGILHHLSDREAGDLLSTLLQGKELERVVTEDPFYVKGRVLNNILGRLDRGRYVRTEAQYLRLIERAGWKVEKTFYCDAGNGLATYLCLGLAKEGA